jgi:hypothetical protein
VPLVRPRLVVGIGRHERRLRQSPVPVRNAVRVEVKVEVEVGAGVAPIPFDSVLTFILLFTPDPRLIHTACVALWYVARLCMRINSAGKLTSGSEQAEEPYSRDFQFAH